ncbi:MAG TPA: TetR/AcrR family transcriptional regulator [Bryobacteraceae bacterium]|jgi:AcrR family transcriptional regulator|nr:TetR/AcrR family transcriptional regulator [Bryobacteraceae bacterium]
MTTKDRILDAAERLFARDGIEATSLRGITAEAGVNLAAVNYHFQSKDALVRAVIARRVVPVNQRRLELLEACERAAGDGPLPLEEVLDAFVRPVVEIYAGHAREFVPLMGRIYTEPAEFVEHIFKDHLESVAKRFIRAWERALPDLPRVELMWRLHFSMGALGHTMGASHILRLFSEGECDPSDVEGTLRRLEAYILAGLKAPVAEVEHAMH